MPPGPHPLRTGQSVAKRGSVILVLLTGGPSHLDTFDMKPDAPAEVRGEFRPMQTRIPGSHICEHLPRLAERMRHWAIVRSLSHGENGHLPATHRLLTGSPMPNQRSSDLDNVLSRRDWPCYAAGLSAVRPRHDGIPCGVSLPHALVEGPLTWPGQHAGFLGPAHDPLPVRQDPNSTHISASIHSQLPILTPIRNEWTNGVSCWIDDLPCDGLGQQFVRCTHQATRVRIAFVGQGGRRRFRLEPRA